MKKFAFPNIDNVSLTSWEKKNIYFNIQDGNSPFSGVLMRSLRAEKKSIVKFLRQLNPWRSSRKLHARNEYADRYDFLRKAFIALKFNSITGDYAEFGCAGANTFCMAYHILAEYPFDVGPFHLWAFDSFQGLPGSSLAKDSHPAWIQGTMATALDEFHRLCSSRGVPRSAYTTVPGFYEQSLDPSAPGPRPEKIRLAYLDCDLYTSTKAVLRFLMPRLQHGMILAFDDYYCYSSTMPSGERLAAAEEFLSNPQWRLLPYIQFGWHGMSFIVEAIGTGNPNGNCGSYW
jgi:O-methyltransferase